MDESKSHQKQLPHAINKTNLLQDYLRDRFFEDFLIIGLPSSEEKRKDMKIGEGRYVPATLFTFYEQN